MLPRGFRAVVSAIVTSSGKERGCPSYIGIDHRVRFPSVGNIHRILAAPVPCCVPFHALLTGCFAHNPACCKREDDAGAVSHISGRTFPAPHRKRQISYAHLRQADPAPQVNQSRKSRPLPNPDKDRWPYHPVPKVEWTMPYLTVARMNAEEVRGPYPRESRHSGCRSGGSG